MSVKLHELKVKKGAVTEHFRKGIGLGTGNGKRAGRGQKGAGARSGAGKNYGYAGGQLPLYRAFPKRGFHSLHDKKDEVIVNLAQLSSHFTDGEKADKNELIARGLVKQAATRVKILAKGELTVKNLEVTADAFSEAAKKAIEAAGGKAIIVAD